MNALVVDAEAIPTIKNTAHCKFDPPFVYWIYGKNIGYIRLGFQIRERYRKYLETDDFKYIEEAIPDISLLVGWAWTRVFLHQDHDRDVMDPVVYHVIFKLTKKVVPDSGGFPNYCKLMIIRELLKCYYKAEQIKKGDRSIRTFTYRPFPTAYDVEHKIFIDDLQDCVLDYITHDTRLDENERNICRYLAVCSLKGDLPSNNLIKVKFGLNSFKDPKRLRFLVDFTDVKVRNYLYRVRESIPNLYGDDKQAYFSSFEYEEEEEDVTDEAALQNRHTQMGYLR